MVTVSPRLKTLRQHLRISLTVNNLWINYKRGLYTKKEIIDSLFIVLDDRNKPSLRLEMLKHRKVNIDKKVI